MIPLRIIRSSAPINYPEALIFMEDYVDKIINHDAPGCIWLLEHPHTITAGTSSTSEDLLKSNQTIPIYETGRGGKYTYHGPGQRIIYIMLNLKLLKQDIRWFVQNLELWLINSFHFVGLNTCVQDKRVGIWVPNSNNQIESKIAAIGLRVKRWVSFHGVAINIDPDLNYFQNILPCGIKEFGVTSFKNEGVNIPMPHIDKILIDEFCKQFNAQAL